MKLIIGLGNPGKEYKFTRHNLGSLILEKFLDSLGQSFSPFRLNKKLKSLISVGKFNDKEKTILAKPQTFMNNSGEAVLKLSKFYKIKPLDFWVIQDEVDLPLGKIKISKNISAAGHKGIQSIIDELKTQNFFRFRIGIASSEKINSTTEKFVLEKFTQKNQLLLQESIKKTVEMLMMALEKGLMAATNKFNQ